MRLQPRFLLLILPVVVSVHAANAQPQAPAVNLRPGAIKSDPNLPQVRVTVDRKRVPLGELVTFTLSPESVVKNQSYVVTLYFGDREQELMRAPKTTHLYHATGTYTYSVGVKSSQTPTPTPTPTSTPTPTPTPTPTSASTPRPTPRPTPPARVTLTASPLPAQQSEPVNFAAQVSGNYSNLQYRFVYGDGSASGWQSRPDAQHSFSRAGNYLAYVDVREGTQSLGGSQRKRVEVMSPLSVSIAASPSPAQSGKPVNFIAKVSSPRTDTRYRFNFGDGARSNWQDDAQAQHSYRTAGSYSAFVQVSQSDNNRTFTATSAPALVSVQQQTTSGPAPAATPTGSTSTSNPGPTPAPATSSSGSSSPDGSPRGSQSSNGSSSPNPLASVPVGSTSPNSASASPSSAIATNLSRISPRAWLYLLIAALLLLLLYQATAYLFAAKPTFTPFSDPGVASVANRKGLPIDFELLLNPNVATGAYSVATDAPRLISNADQWEDRQIIEI